MAITATDILFLKSSSGTSDGGAESATEITSGLENDLWPDISDALRASDGSRSKKFFIKNDSATETASSPSVWISEFPAGVDVLIGYGSSTSDDADSAGGVLTDMTADALIALVCSASDSRTATVYGLNASGAPQSENVSLNGTSEVLTVGTYSVLYAVELSTLSATVSVTVKQGTGGTSRGVIGPGLIIGWMWVNAGTKATGIRVPDLLPGSSIPIWCVQSWGAGVTAQRPTRQVVAFEEGA